MKLETYIQPFQSLVLGTFHADGYPFGSYAPFIYKNNKLYILISDIATHAKNLQAYPKASAFFIEDESISPNIFARKRISLQCDTEKLAQDTSLFQELIGSFKEKFDDSMVSMLMQMPDFNFYALTPIKGEATFGFGKAYILGGENKDQLLPRSMERE